MTYGTFLIYFFMDKTFQLVACMIYSKGVVAYTFKKVLEILETNYINNCLWLHKYVFKFNV